jgi:type III pantothenate kinase
MLLAVDIGNSNIVFGFYDGKTLLTTLRIATDHARTSDESAMILSQFVELKRLPSFEAMVIASVVPKL